MTCSLSTATTKAAKTKTHARNPCVTCKEKPEKENRGFSVPQKMRGEGRQREENPKHQVMDSTGLDNDPPQTKTVIFEFGAVLSSEVGQRTVKMMNPPSGRKCHSRTSEQTLTLAS
ncbi:hypothetical protein AVEN_18310-1 [Araneus ventricosus]|uniref:Uncharacterized protein n=1 Tax=Araneus ventricosus TaxID=182803 RepID=A0A4Y2UIZ8_ARAVE|nr:hypothetical protein AVEN_18310-1 [Araneus ventricosus]